MEKKKKMLSDSIWSIAGLVTVNVALQFAVYPFWERRAGEAALGNILYLISLMNVFAVSMGVSANYARLKKSAEGNTHNTPYLAILGGATAVCAIVGIFISLLGGVDMTLFESVLFIAVMCATMWRYYLDVDFKLSLKYRSYFFYYLSIALGYALGIVLFYVTGLWPLTLLVGELFGIIYVFVKGTVLRPEGVSNSDELKGAFKLITVLLGSEILSTLIFNADRILIKAVLGEVAVTEFYLASLLGKTIALLTAPLTGVIVGYLSKYRGDLKVKGMNLMLAVAIAAIALATVACTVGSYIIIPILYPAQLEDVKRYFIMANLSQVTFFVGSVLTVVLLLFSKSKYQIYITVIYACTFAAVCIPFSIKFGLYGFCVGLTVTCLARLLVTLALGYYTALKNKTRREEAL